MDQRKLPWAVEWVELTSAEMAATAISEMWTRGAPLIGATAAYGLCMALRADASDASLDAAHDRLLPPRPTAPTLTRALDRMGEAVRPLAPAARTGTGYARAPPPPAPAAARNPHQPPHAPRRSPPLGQ